MFLDKKEKTPEILKSFAEIFQVFDSPPKTNKTKNNLCVTKQGKVGSR